MINPYELNNVFRKEYDDLVGDPTNISMTQSLRRIIEQTLYYDVTSTLQEILFFKVPLPTNPIDQIDPIDQITFEFILNFILFDGGRYTFEDPSRFNKFFLMLNWKYAQSPRLNNLASTGDVVISIPLSIFNFFMNLPFVIWNFDFVKNTNPKPIGTLLTSVSFLSRCFVPIFTGSFTISEIKQLMNQYYKNNPDIFKECMRDMLRFLYTIEYSKRATISETAAENYFKKVLEPICKFISSTSGRSFTIEQQQPIIVNVADFIGTIQNEDTRCIRPDLVIYEGKQARIVIEMKAPPLFIGFKIPKFYEMTSSLSEVIEEEDDFSVSDGQRLHKVLKQLLIYMIGLKCSRGIVSDGYSVILVEIDILKLEKEDKKNQVNQIPLKLTTFDCKSSNPSYIQGILYFLMKAVLEPSNLGDKLLHFKVALQTREEVIRGNIIVIGGKKSNADNGQNKGRPTNYQTSKGSKSHNVDEPSSYSSHPCVLQTPPTSAESDDQSIINPLISSLFISWEDKPTVLQNAFDYLSHVVKIKAKFVKSYILEDIDDEDDVVVKIFDPKLTKIEKLDRVDIIENVNTFYRSEKRSAEVLTRMDVDTLYLKQIYGNAIYNYGHGPLIMGKFIVSKYVASEKFPITTEVFNMAREQLSKIHEVDIAHGDIRESNILFNKEYNKVYLLDFGHAVIKDIIEDSNEDSNEDNHDVNYGFNDEQAADRAYLAEVFSGANE